MTWQIWIMAAVSAVGAVAFGLWRQQRGRRLDRVVSDARSGAVEADRAAAEAEARVETRRAADARADDRSAENAERTVDAVRAAPPVPDESADGIRVGRRPRSQFADELGLD